MKFYPTFSELNSRREIYAWMAFGIAAPLIYARITQGASHNIAEEVSYWQNALTWSPVSLYLGVGFTTGAVAGHLIRKRALLEERSSKTLKSL